MTDRVVLTSPDHFLAAIPHFVGFMPEKSLVVACFTPNDNGMRDTSLLVTARIDLPTPESDPLGMWAPNMAESLARTGTRSVLIAVVDADAKPAPGTPWPHQDAIDTFIAALDDRGIDALDVLFTDGERRWSIGCTEEVCCPGEGVPINADARALVDAEFAFASNGPRAASRAELVAEVAAAEVDGVGDLIERFVNERPGLDADALSSDQWRMGQVDMLHTIAAWPENMAAEDIANVAVALTDIHVRDTYLRDLAEPGSNMDGAIAMLRTTVKGAPEAFVAPPATLLATVHYWNGDGARTNVALDRAADYGQEYSLATLMRQTAACGITPASHREAVLSLSRDECFWGPMRVNAMSPSAALPAAPIVQPITPNQSLAL